MYKIFLNLYVDLSTCIYFFFQIKGNTLKYGISLRMLIWKSAELSGPCLLITGDTRGAVFGGLLNCPLTPTPKRKYQGTYETFVFTTLYGAPRLFRPTGANRYFYICLNDMLALGGGGNFALCLNEDFYGSAVLANSYPSLPLLPQMLPRVVSVYIHRMKYPR